MDYKNLNMHTGSKIKQCRNSLAITQEQLAETIGISQSYLGQIERGVRGISLETLIKIANALNVSIDYLLSDYLRTSRDDIDSQWSHLLSGKTQQHKELLIAMVKDLEKYIGKGN